MSCELLYAWTMQLTSFSSHIKNKKDKQMKLLLMLYFI